MGDSGPMDATVDIFENNISQGECNKMFLFTLKNWTKYFPVTLQPLLDTAAETLKCIPVHAREEI